jgi:hypothetical protein
MRILVIGATEFSGPETIGPLSRGHKNVAPAALNPQ